MAPSHPSLCAYARVQGQGKDVLDGFSMLIAVFGREQVQPCGCIYVRGYVGVRVFARVRACVVCCWRLHTGMRVRT